MLITFYDYGASIRKIELIFIYFYLYSQLFHSYSIYHDSPPLMPVLYTYLRYTPHAESFIQADLSQYEKS